MAAATKQKKADTRLPNIQPNHLGATIALGIFRAGVKLGVIHVPQGDKLSPKGNITFSGGIRKGWKLEGTDPNAVLAELSFTANGAALNASNHGVHESGRGNPTICHTAVLALPSGEHDVLVPTGLMVAPGLPGQTVETVPAGVVAYMIQVYPTYSNAKGAYNLTVSAFPMGSGESGPQVVGEIEGDGIILG